jgi:putative component of membrane protein insertase Oxa1/YidC/SpoIIIJ protein YidD
MRSFVKLFAIFAVAALLAEPVALANEAYAWGLWPKQAEKENGETAGPRPSWVHRLYHWYQDRVSAADGAACPFYPTCSAFALQALTRHGIFYGGTLTIDRLLSEYPGMPKSNLYPLITKYGVHRPYDPVP